MIKKVLIGMAVVMLLGLVSFEIYFQSHSSADPAVERENSGMDFVELSHGKTYYKLHGKSGDPLLVLIHGISTPHFVFDGLIEDFVKNGHQVLVYDLLGRGLSDKPRIDYHKEVFPQQLAEMLKTLELHETPKVLVGYSMGGVVAAMYTQENPKYVLAHVYIAPGGFFKIEKPAIFTALPQFVLERMIFLNSMSYYKKMKSKSLDAAERFKTQSHFSGYYHALMSTIIHFEDVRSVYRDVMKQKKPTLFLWGLNDKMVPYEKSEELVQEYPEKGVVVVEDASHAINLTHPEKVSSEIKSFLKARAIFSSVQP